MSPHARKSLPAVTQGCSGFCPVRHCGIVVADPNKPRASVQQSLFSEEHHQLIPCPANFVIWSNVAHESDAHRFEVLDYHVRGLVLDWGGIKVSEPPSILVMHAGGSLNPRAHAIAPAESNWRQSEVFAKGAAEGFMCFIARLKRNPHDRVVRQFKPPRRDVRAAVGGRRLPNDSDNIPVKT